MEEGLIAIFGRVLETAKDGKTDAEAGHRIRTLLAEQGGIDTLAERCETVSAWHGNNDLPLLWPIHANTRNLLFRLLDLMDIRSATQDRSLLDALAVVARHRHARRDDLPEQLDLGFASQRWQSFVVKRRRPASFSAGVRSRSASLSIWPTPCKPGISTSSAPRISATTGPNFCRGQHASRAWRPIATPSECRRPARSSSPN